MPFKRHQDSQTAGVSQVAASFDVPDTQDSVAYGGNRLWDVIPPQESASSAKAGSALTWEVPQSTAMTSVAESSIIIQGSYVFANATDAYNSIGDPLPLGCQIESIALDQNNPADKHQYEITGLAKGINFTFKNDNIGTSQTIAAGDIVTWTAIDETVLLNDPKNKLVGSAYKVLTYTQAQGYNATFNAIAAGGTNYAVASNVATTGGTGDGLTVNITTVNGGAVTGITVQSMGSGYADGETLTITGGGADATFTISVTPATQASMIIDMGQELSFVGGATPSFLGWRLAQWNGSTLSTPAFLSAFMFDDLTIEVNGTTVVPSQGKEQPYAVISSVIKNEPYAQRKAGDRTRGYLIGSESGEGVKGVNSTAAASNQEQLKFEQIRRDMYMDAPTKAESQVRFFELEYRLADAGLRPKGSWLPPGTQLRVRARLNPNPSLLVVDANLSGTGYANDAFGPQPAFQLQKCEMLVARKELNETAEAQLQAAWVERPMKFPFERVRTFIQFVSGGIPSVNVVGALAGPTPKCIYAFAVTQNALQGSDNSGTYNASRLVPPAFSTWSDARISIGGARTYPVQPLSVTQSGSTGQFGPQCMAQLYQMYLSTCNEYPFLTSHNLFADIQPLCFQVESSTDGYDVAEDVSVQFQGTLNNSSDQAIPAWALILVSFTDTIVEIQNSLETIVM